jgi:hypothetical protein
MSRRLFGHNFPLHSLLLLAVACLFSAPYRVSLLIQPAWLAYLILTVVLSFCFLVFLTPPGFSGGHRPQHPFIWGLLVIATLLPRLYWMHRYPVDAQYGDMLPLIQLAGEKFLSGAYPYTGYELPWPLPLTFFPGLWMSYLPALMLGSDLRWIGLCGTLGCIILMGKNIHSRAGLGVLVAFALLPVFHFFTVNGHTQSFWFMLCGFGYCFVQGMPLRAAFFLGLALATRQTALVLFPFAMLGWWRELGSGKAWRPGVLCAGLTGLICLPFFLINPDAFLFEPLRHYQELARSYQEGAGDPAYLLETFGFANLAHLGGFSQWLAPARLMVWIFGLAGCLYFARTPRDHIRWMAVTALCFTLFTPIPWIYAYFPYWLLAYFGISQTERIEV